MDPTMLQPQEGAVTPEMEDEDDDHLEDLQADLDARDMEDQEANKEEEKTLIGDALESKLNNLDEETKSMIADMLTPEIANMIGHMFGNSVYEYLVDKTNKDIILIPMPRKLVQEQIMAGESFDESASPQDDEEEFLITDEE